MSKRTYKDKNGKERELHIDKALKVTDLQKFTPITFEDCLGRCEYFTVERYAINGEMNLFADEKSFHCITCVKGQGEINGQAFHQGHSYFIPAGNGEYTLAGTCEVILTKV